MRNASPKFVHKLIEAQKGEVIACPGAVRQPAPAADEITEAEVFRILRLERRKMRAEQRRRHALNAVGSALGYVWLASYGAVKSAPVVVKLPAKLWRKVGASTMLT